MIQFTDFTTLAIQLGVVIFLVESITETVKGVFKGEAGFNSKVEFILALVVGIAASVILNISLFETDNHIFFYVGSVLAGAVASRGANHMHDILKMLGSLRKK